MINIDVNRPTLLVHREEATEWVDEHGHQRRLLHDGSNRITCEDVWVCLDAYDQEGITIEETEGIVIVSHVRGGDREVVYSAKIEQP